MFWQFILALGAFLSSPEPRQHMPPVSDEYDIDIHQQALENDDLVGGDMIIPREQWATLGNAIADEKYRWPGYPGGATVPYVIDSSVRGYTALIESAMKQYHDNTCVRFVKRTTEKQYVKIYKGRGCFAMVGRNLTTSQPQPLSLGDGCYKIGTVIHELGHVLGFYHEQNRSDRDQYLNIYLNNVKPALRHNFVKLRPDQNILINNFDYDSIMIYGNYAFSKRPNVLKTMEAKNGQKLLNPYEKSSMTASDIQRVKTLYKC